MSEFEVGRWFAASPIMQIAGMVVALFLVVWLTILGERRWRITRHHADPPRGQQVGAIYIPPDRQGDMVNLLERIEGAINRLDNDLRGTQHHTADALARIGGELTTIRRTLSDIEQRKPARRS